MIYMITIQRQISPPTPQRGEQPTLGSVQICNNAKSSLFPPFGGVRGGLNHSSNKKAESLTSLAWGIALRSEIAWSIALRNHSNQKNHINHSSDKIKDKNLRNTFLIREIK